jgi:sec-independent protein translocase protein TatC
VVTPPDVFSQVSLAVPLLLLYEVSIWLARMVEKDRAKISEDSDSDDDAGTEVTPA